MSNPRDCEVKEVGRVLQWEDDPREEDQRYARWGMDERTRALFRRAVANMDRSCGFNRAAPGGRRIRYRLVGNKLVREAEEGERKDVTTNGGLGESPSSAAAAGSEDELCSGFRSVRF
ncbi:hypothetical protein ACP70R_005283 [Stipagrostis hirtigluma subsp. patula]